MYVVILVYGYVIVSSIVNVVNWLLKNMIFELFDMLLDVMLEVIVQQVMCYLEEYLFVFGLMILVDMGLFKVIYCYFDCVFFMLVMIINNVLISMVLYVGECILQGYFIEEIVCDIVWDVLVEYQFYWLKSNKLCVILIICVIGIGVVMNFCVLLSVSILQVLEIDVVVCDYVMLVSNKI